MVYERSWAHGLAGAKPPLTTLELPYSRRTSSMAAWRGLAGISSGLSATWTTFSQTSDTASFGSSADIMYQ